MTQNQPKPAGGWLVGLLIVKLVVHAGPLLMRAAPDVARAVPPPSVRMADDVGRQAAPRGDVPDVGPRVSWHDMPVNDLVGLAAPDDDE